MATLEELYRYYLNQPITYVPGSTIGGLSSLTEINRNDVGGGDSSESSNTVSVSSTPGKGIAGVSYSDMAKALGFAMNPALGIANMVATSVLGKSPMSMAMEAMGFGGSDSTSTGTANATDTGDMGSEAANAAATSSAGGGDQGGPGGGDSGDTGGPFRDGGRVGLYDGGSAFDNYRAPQLMNNRIYYLQGGLASLLR